MVVASEFAILPLTAAITGRQQEAKPAVAAPVHCTVGRHAGVSYW